MIKNTALTLLLLVALIAIGVLAAFAMWSETLKVNSYIGTGEVDVAFTGWECTDQGPDQQFVGYSNEEGKDVADCNVSIERVDDEGDVIKLLVIIDNAYPGYYVMINLNITNVGTIPVKLFNQSFTGLEGLPLAVGLTVPPIGETQIEPSETDTYTLVVAVLQDADENASYSFELALAFAQWNEVNYVRD